MSVVGLVAATALAWPCWRKLIALVLEEMVDFVVLSADQQIVRAYKLAPINGDHCTRN